MITISNTTEIPEIIQATQKANELLKSPAFFDAIRAHASFDMANVSPAVVATLMGEATVTMIIEMYFSRNRRVFGYDDPAHPEIIHINQNRNEFNVPALVNTMLHETVHAVDDLNPEASFGHGDNSSAGKENTAPYWIGSLAERMAGGQSDQITLQIHEGSPEAFNV